MMTTARAALRDRMRSEIAGRVPVVDFSGSASLEMAVLRQDLDGVTEYLYELGRRHHLDVQLGTKRQRLHLKRALLLEIDGAVAGASVFTVRIRDRRTKETCELDVQVWEENDDHLEGPVANEVVRRISKRVAHDAGWFRRGAPVEGRALHAKPLADEPQFPVDVVYTWVDHRDPRWRELHASVASQDLGRERADGRALDRFKSRDELKYSLRAVARFAPWVRQVFVVTNCSVPSWLDASHPQIHWVDHEEILPASCLPTFNSHAIESRLHAVPGLSQHFLYLNDDVFLTRPTRPGDFFGGTGLSRSFMDTTVAAIGEPHPDEPDFLNAARNGRKLLEDAFHRTAFAMPAHAPFALRRDVLSELEERFEPHLAATRRSRFRSRFDISTVSFLYQHYAYLTCRAMYQPADALVLTHRAHRYDETLDMLLAGDLRPLSLCLNDGFGSASVSSWDQAVTRFLDAYYPAPGPWERRG